MIAYEQFEGNLRLQVSSKVSSESGPSIFYVRIHVCIGCQEIIFLTYFLNIQYPVPTFTGQGRQ